MPKHHIQKALQDYLSKIKRETKNIHLSSNSFSSSKNWVLSGCKHPKTLSFSINRKHMKGNKNNSEENEDEYDKDTDNAATLSDIDRFLEENFKSLCIRDDDDDMKKEKKRFEEEDDDEEEEEEEARVRIPWGPIKFDSPKRSDTPRKSERFFAAPGSSGLLTEEKLPSMTTTTTSTATLTEDAASSSNSSPGHYRTNGAASTEEVAAFPENCIAVLKYTPDPYEDFRRSMLEMLEARLALRGTKVDWEFMEELLFCYLNLNDKKYHRFVLGAFADLIVVLRQNEKTISRKSLIRSRSIRVARERTKRRMKHL